MPRSLWCPFHSSLDNAALFPPSHPCFTVYDERRPGELLTTGDLDRMLMHTTDTGLRDVLLDIRNGERGDA